MALDERTKALIENTNKLFENTEPQKIDLSNWSRISESDVMSAQPVATQQRFEDYSRYIKGAIDPIYGDIDEERAQAQSNFAKAATVLPRIGTKVIAEVAKIPGEIYGLVDWGVSGFKLEDFEEKVNNVWVRSIEEAHRATNDAILPVYTRRVVEEGGLFRQIISPEFWANEGADGVGFLVSMMGPGLLTRAAGVGSKVGRLAKLTKLAKGETAAKTASNIKAISGWADDIISGGINTIVESTAEGIEAANATRQALEQNKFKELIDAGFSQDVASQMTEDYMNSTEAKRKIGAAGANTVRANLGILLASNIIDQKWLFSGLTKGAIASDLVESKLGKVVAGLGKEASEKVGRATTKEIRNEFLKKFGIGVAKEGFFEEGMQFASAKYFEDKAILGEDPNFLESIGGTLETYIESLSDVDMQKSIFLGSLLGGVMGGVGAARNVRLEDKVLFGDKKRGTVGLANLLEQNFINRFRSLNDITEKDADGNPLRDVDGVSPKINPVAYKAWMVDILKDEKNKKLLEAYNEAGLMEDFEFAKMVHDFNYMLPFIQQEGGMELLQMHLNQLSEKQAEYLQSIGVDNRTVESVKKELQDKANIFSKIYYDTIENYKPFNVPVDEKHLNVKQQLDNEMLDTKVSNQLIQHTLRDRVANVRKESTAIQSEISKLEAQPILTNTEEVRLKELTKQKEVLDKKAEDILKEIELYKESFKQLDDKEAYQEELNLRIKEQEELKKEAAKNIADNVQTKEDAEEVKTSVEETDLDKKTKQDVKDKADAAANNKEAEREILKAADEKTLRAIAAKAFKNFQAKKEVDPLTPEEQELIVSNPENALKLEEYFKELQDADRITKERKANQEKVNKYVEYTEIWEQESLDDINEDTLSTWGTYYNSETNSIEKELLEGDSIEDLYEKISNFYSEKLKNYSSYIDVKPPAYTSKALEQLNATRTFTEELTPVPESDTKDEEGENNKANKSDVLEGALVATVPAVAYRSKQGKDSTEGVIDLYDSDGKVQIQEDINEDILYSDKYGAGTELIAEIDTDSMFYEENKNNIESVPIKLTDRDGNFVGYIHTLEWYDRKVNLDPALKALLKEQTLTMRNNFLVNGKIENRRLVTKIVDKNPGWLNRTKKQKDKKRIQLSVNDAFGKDSNVKIGVLNTTGPTGILAELNWAKDKDGNYLNQLLNKATASGIVIAAVPSANGSYLLTRMNQNTLSSVNKDVADNILRNVVGILMNAVKDNTINKNDLFTQLKPYLYAHMGLSSKEKQSYVHSNPGILFGVDLFDSGTERNVVVDLDFGTNTATPLHGYIPFKIVEKDGKIIISRGKYVTDSTGKINFSTQEVITPKEFGEYIKKQTKNKYINYDQSLMNEWYKGKKVKILEADDNYNVKEREVDYRDFISENRILTTAVHGVKTKDGRTTYVTQPTLELDWNNFKEDIITVQEITTTPQEPTTPSTELPRTNRLTDENLDFDGFEGFEETITDFLKISVDIDYNNANIASFSNLSNLIRENELVNSLTASAIFLNKTVNIDFDTNPNALLDEVKKALEVNRGNFELFSTKVPTAEEAATYKVAMNPKINAAIANNLKQVLDNFEEVRDEQGKIKFIGYRTKINMELNKLKFTPEEMEMLESMPENGIEELHLDNKTFRTDPEKSMSSRVKRELYSLPIKEKGKAKVSMVGLPLVRDYSTTFNSLMEALSNEDINEMINELRELANSPEITDELYKQTLELIEKHSNNDSTFVNEFLSVFKKQKANFKIAIIESQTIEEVVNGEKVTILDNPKITIIDANKSGAANLLMDKWKPAHEQALVDMGMLKIDNVNDNYTINQKIAGELATGFISVSNKITERIKKSIETNKFVTSEAFKELSDYFNKVGLSVSPEALFKLYKDYLRGKSKKLAALTLPSERSNNNFPLFLKTNFGYIFSKYMDEGGENKISESGLDLTAFKTQRQFINVLAKYESIVNPSVISNSFRNGNGDIIYGYVNPSHLSNTIDKLKKDTSIEADVFSRHSTWKFKTDENGELSINEQALKDLDLHYFDSTKNRFSKKDAVSFEEMNPLEREQTKLSMYHNNTSRLGLFYTVSPSDKTTFSLIQAAKQNIAKSDLTQDGLLKNGTQLVDSLFDLFVVSEIDRINETLNKFRRYKKGELTLNQLTNEVDYIKTSDGTIVPGAGSYFFMIPQFNDYYAKELELAHKEVMSGNEGLIRTHIVPDRVTEAKGEMVRLINMLVDLKKNHWDSLDMYKRINKESFINFTNKYKGFNVNTAIATDYVVNTMISYANQFMLITGDPATFAKVPKGFDGKISSWRNLVDTSTANLFKRAAKDIAPGYEGRFEPSEQKYRNVFINEPVVVTKTIYKDYEGVLKDVLTVDSSKIKLADAQIWSSLPEHLRVLNAIGRINKTTKDALIAKYNNYMKHRFEPDNKFKFTDAELGIILQPIKPVEVGFVNDPNSNKKLPIYLKSSKFPLIPQLTEGLEIDKMLTFMYENNIDNIVPHTAIKTGFSNAIDLFDGERIVLPETIEQDRIHVLDRSIFRIQQDVPYDPNKTKILEGSQLKKLKYSDLELDWNFELNGTLFKGHELKDMDDRIHTELYRRAYNDFLKSIKAEETAEGTITLEDFSEISKAIIEEAQERGFDINDVMLLSTFLSSSGRTVSSIPLFLHPAMPKIEPLLNSLVKNKILVTKFPGKSYVQGSSLGFQFAQVGDEATIEKVVKKQGIVLTSKFTGKLSYASEKKGDKEVLVADVFVPWYFKEKLTNFLNEDGTLNEDMIDPEMLNLIGYRIPTQGHSSMIKLRVVGFLPESSGDLIIIPPDLVKQMGSDFDVDKLYVNRYNYKTSYDFKKLKEFVKNKLSEKEISDLEYTLNNLVNSAEDIDFWGDNYKDVYTKYKTLIADNKVNFITGINKITTGNYTNLEELSKEQLQNLSLEITHSILENENVIKRTVTPLDNNKVRDAISEMNQLKKESNVVDLSKASHTSLLYDGLHSQFVDINAAGKFGIGVSSIASTGHVLGQYAGFYIKTIRRKNAPPIRMAVRFTDVVGNPEFNEVEGSKNGVKQTSVKQQKYDDNVGFGLWRLDRIYNIAGETISSVIQNIQTESVDNANNQNLYGMGLNKHTFDVALFLAKAGLSEEYIIMYLNQPIIKEYIKRVNAISDIGSTEYTFGKEEEIAKEMGYKPEINEIPIIAFKSHPTKGGESLSKAIEEEGRAFNDFDRQVLHSFMKYKEIANKLSGVLRAINVDTRYLGKNLDSNISKQKEFETNIINQKQFGNLQNLEGTLQESAFRFGVDAAVAIFDNLVPYNTPIIKYLREKQKIISGRDMLSEDVLNEMNRSIRTSLWVESLKRSTNISDIESYRKNLLFNSDPDKKDALAFKVAKERLTNNNTFLKFLELNLQSGTKNPSTIEFPAGGNVETDFSLKMQQALLDLYNNPETKQLARDLMIYALTNGAERNARDFARFIPIDMLISEGIINNLKSVYGEAFSSIELNENLKSVFLKQFYQHNPFRAFPASTRDLLKRHKIDGKGNATTYLNNTHRIKMKISELDGKSIANTPEFIYFYDNGKYFLFNRVELTEENVVYERVPLLGNKTSMLTEYNLTTPNKESIFSDNNIAGLVPYQRTTNIQIAPKPTESFTGVNIASKFGFIHQGTNFNQVLNNITQSDQISNGLKALANILATQQFNVTMEVGDNNTVAGKETLKGKFGAFIPSNKGDKIVVNLDSLVPNFGLNADNAFALGILHEAIHALTSSKIENRKNLSTEEQQIIDNIEKQWKKAKDVIDNNDGLKEFRYYTSSLKEFVAGLSDPRFQRVLNDIKSEGNQSILDKIIDLITEMINIVAKGIDINSDSVLAQTLQDVLKLTGGLRADVQQPTTEQTTTNLDENISSPGTQGSWVPTDESPIYKELSGGNLYKFELTGGIVSKGYYAQGNSLDWKEMNPKKASKKYNEIERDGVEQTGKFVEYDSKIKEFKEQPIANIFKFADGIEINTGNIKLNQQQTEALQHLSDFYNNKTKTFALKGYAGTGKTTILNFFKEYVAEKNRQLMLQGNFKDRRYIQFTTPTHRANAIIRLNTKSPVNTLHSLFGLSPVLDLEEFSARDAKFAQQNQKKISAGDLLIIDESSMINDALYDFITKEADKSDVKVIFVGDPKQLKPVKQDKLSKAFSQVDGTYELTQVMRTGDTPLLSEVTSIRMGNNFSYQTSLTNNQGIVYTNNRRSFTDLASEIFMSQQFRENPSVVRILSGTNDGVREMNELVRKALWGEAITNQYNVGELLIGFDNYNIQYGNPTIMNSVDYFVRDVSEETDIELSGVKAKVINILVEDMFDLDNPNRFKKVTMLSKNNPSHVFEELGATFEMLRLRAISESNKGNNSYWKQFYAFKDSFATPVDISFKGDVKIKKTLDYGYAMTIHKSQGGTYGQIYLDADSINKFPDNEVQQQLKYVGLSRASNVAVVLSNKTNKDGTTELTKETVVSEPTLPQQVPFESDVNLGIYKGSRYSSKERPLQIYTDGSDIKGTGKIGSGVWFEYNGNEYSKSTTSDAAAFKEAYNIEDNVSNPTMEMVALVDALYEFQDTGEHLEIYADYEGVQKWINGEWKIKKSYIKDLVDTAKEMIAKIESNGGSVQLKWVKGHSGVKGNDMSDAMAKSREQFNTIKQLFRTPYDTIKEDFLKLNTSEKSSTFVKPDNISQESWDRLNDTQKQRLLDCR